MGQGDSDLHGSAPDTCPVALLLVDVINPLDFPEADALLREALPMAERIHALRERAHALDIPVVYVNDNFGRWRSDFSHVVERCLEHGCKGAPITRLLRPTPRDYFVLKPKHSGFFASCLETLLDSLGARRLVLTGMAANLCVVYTANDAYMRDYTLSVPRDCVASNTPEDTATALRHMGTFLKADTRPADRVPLEELLRGPPRRPASG